MGIFDDLFGGGNNSNPADSAMPYYNQIPGMEKDAYNPYIQRGNDAYNKSSPIFDKMTSDPAGFFNSLLQQYVPSKAYQLQRDEATRAAGNSAAAGGMRGGLQDVTNQSRLTDTLMGNDMQQWFKNVMGLEDTGLTGEQNSYNNGFDATKALTGDLSNVLGTQGSLAFQGQANENQSHSDLMNSLMKLAGGAAGWYLGGPVGGAVASKFF